MSIVVQGKGKLNKQSGIKDYKMEIAVVILYTVLHVLLCLFHEGCFDEVHAWNIAKDGCLFDIIFKVPHTEGHPALWHLLLVPFAKAGLPYKLSALIVTTFFSTIMVSVLEFKAPFFKLIKCLLPFSYFFFYQYGVIARPYCMMMPALLLLASLYKERDKKPVRYTLALVFLSATSAFGTALAGGMAAVWLWKIIIEYVKKENDISISLTSPKNKSIFKNIRIYCLIALLVYALFLLVRVLPLNPYGGMSYVGVRQNGILVRCLYLFFGLFSDLCFTNSYTHDFLADFHFDRFELITTCFIGAIILLAIFYLGKKIKNLLEFIIPYISLSTFSALVYFGVHNSGILFIFLIYWLWISWDRILELLDSKDTKNKNRKMNINPGIVGVVFLLLPLFWSVSASVTDIKYTYSFGEKEAEFLKENGLDDKGICFEWKTVRDESKIGTLEYYDMKHIINMDRLYAYMDNPNFLNWPFDYSLYTFFHEAVTDEENKQIIENLMANPKPDVLIGDPDLTMLNGLDYEVVKEYQLVYIDEIVKPWKSLSFKDITRISVRRE